MYNSFNKILICLSYKLINTLSKNGIKNLIATNLITEAFIKNTIYYITGFPQK